MDFFQVISLHEAIARLQKQFADNPLEIETVCLLDAQNRFLADDLYAAENVPDFNRSTVDGYAVKAADTFGAGEALPSLLTAAGAVRMGQKAEMILKKGQAVSVPTGGMLPEGADSVVMVEYSEQFDADTIAVYKPVSPGENVIARGDDMRQGDVILKRGTWLSAKHIAMLAACGISRVNVYRPIRFAIISTGDEIIEIDQPQEIGQIRDINSYGLASIIRQWGGAVTYRAIVRDDYEALKQAMTEGLEQADVLLTSGGSSVGERDYTYRLMQELCKDDVFVKGIAIKPGKPTIAGKSDGKPVIGLPGHPSAAMTVFRVLMSAVMKQWGLYLEETLVPARLSVNLPSSPGRTTFQMVQLEANENGFTAMPIFGKSGMIHLLGRSDGYIVLEAHQEGLEQNQQVLVHLL
ncbi:MAG: molybdopterin molybdotransferase MoeA [Peptococcaceae bacterium]|nr:molybdopterin molybdotransferase MoeA [Peptococcaceae bacterium]